jgi:hypothetical protein
METSYSKSTVTVCILFLFQQYVTLYLHHATRSCKTYGLFDKMKLYLLIKYKILILLPNISTNVSTVIK